MPSRPATLRPIAAAISVIAGVLLQGGCATTGNSITQTVTVETPGCAMARCELSNDLGRWTVPSTPGAVSITTSAQPLEIVCRAPGLTSQPVPLRARSAIDERGKAGAVSGGVAGAGAGVAIGTALGAGLLLTPAAPLVLMFVAAGAGTGVAMGTVFDEASLSVRYPETIAVPLVCQPAAPLDPDLSAAPVGIVVRGLTDGEATAAGLAGRDGVIVMRLAAGGRAARAGLRERDFVVRCNDVDVADATHLRAIVHASPPDQPLRLVVLRNGQPVEISLPQKAPSP